ncbi:THAP domain-containing protein 1-like, partial [Saccoglossus kowalevskii]
TASMVHNCCVPECPKAGYRIQDGRKVSFHKIPSREQIRLKWIHAIKRDPGKHFTISKHTKVCSLHFHEDDFTVDQFPINHKLRPNAVPSVFDFTPKL